MEYIVGLETEFPGVDFVVLKGGQVIGIDMESVMLYQSKEQWLDGRDVPAPCIIKREDASKSFDQETFDKAVEDAVNTFWLSVCPHYPHIKSGDMAPEQELAFKQACETAIKQWVRNNE
jgi:hypothetical protein